MTSAAHMSSCQHGTTDERCATRGRVGPRSRVGASMAAQIAPFGASDEVRPEDDLPSIAAATCALSLAFSITQRDTICRSRPPTPAHRHWPEDSVAPDARRPESLGLGLSPPQRHAEQTDARWTSSSDRWRLSSAPDPSQRPRLHIPLLYLSETSTNGIRRPRTAMAHKSEILALFCEFADQRGRLGSGDWEEDFPGLKAVSPDKND